MRRDFISDPAMSQFVTSLILETFNQRAFSAYYDAVGASASMQPESFF